MREKLAWFKALPFGIAFRLVLLYTGRRISRIETFFSFSQHAEDLILTLFPTRQKGVYIDVGCNDPIKYSNTFSLYLAGWRGINIDANSELVKECKRVKKQDISICAAVSDEKKEVVLHKAKNSLVSTIDEENYAEGKEWWEENTVNQETMMTETLTNLLDENLKHGNEIDILSIDVEGHDLKVLKGLDFHKYRPKVIAVECRSLVNIEHNEIHVFLLDKNYSLVAFSGLTGFYLSA